jgi:N-acetylmuramoyl-L-alanine amidase
LKSPDIPSVLVEIGFLSSERDRKNLVDREWRLRMAHGIRNGLRAWGEADALRPRVFGQ